MKKTLNHLKENREAFLEELKNLLRIPSVSTDPKYKDDVKRCAEFIRLDLVNSGVQLVKIFETNGHPIVYGEHIIDEDRPTILFYGHYDVQPADPREKWDTAPFDPVIKITDIHPDGAIFARGAADDKGQIHMFLKAIQAMIKTGELPCNFKILIEGEEEIGSVHLEQFCIDNKNMLSADGVLVCDTSIISNTMPSIPISLRGLSYMEVKVTGPNRDLHSGVYGGPVVNP